MGGPWQTFAWAAATIFMISLDATVVVAAFPALMESFPGVSAPVISWAINGYSIIFAALLVPFGRMVDRVGARRSFLIGLVGFTGGSAASALAPSAEWLTAARVLQAIGAALASPATLALILGAFPARERSRVAGLWSAVGALAAALGPLIGSVLIDLFSWRSIFLINLPIGLVVLGSGWKDGHGAVPPLARVRFDPLGTLLLVAGVSALAGGLSNAGGHDSTLALVSIASGMILLIFFAFWARRRPDAAVDFELFASPEYRWASAAMFMLGVAFGMMFLTFYLFFRGVWLYPQSLAGLAATPGPLTATLVAVAVSKQLAHRGAGRLIGVGAALFVASNLWLALMIRIRPDYVGTWLPGQILGGVAIGIMLPSLTGKAISALSPHQWGVGGAVTNALRQLGSALGVAAAVALVGEAMLEVGPFRLVYWSLAAVGAVIALLSIPLWNRRPGVQDFQASL